MKNTNLHQNHTYIYIPTAVSGVSKIAFKCVCIEYFAMNKFKLQS